MWRAKLTNDLVIQLGGVPRNNLRENLRWLAQQMRVEPEFLYNRMSPREVAVKGLGAYKGDIWADKYRLRASHHHYETITNIVPLPGTDMPPGKAVAIEAKEHKIMMAEADAWAEQYRLYDVAIAKRVHELENGYDSGGDSEDCEGHGSAIPELVEAKKRGLRARISL